MTVLAGPASERLGAGVSERLGVPLLRYECRRFPDGEAEVELHETVRGRHVYLIHSTSPPVDRRLIELALLADACHRGGAARLTGVIPYFGYARQERRTDRRSLGARVAAKIVATGGFERLMLVDAHTPAIEGFFDVPIDHLSAVPLLAEAVRASAGPDPVVVAPDLGAVKRAREFGRRLDAPLAFVHKTRLSGREVEAHAVIGDVRGRHPLIVDDMLSTGATIEAAIGALRDAGALEPVTVAVTHAILAGNARDLLRRLPIVRLIATDTVDVEPAADMHLEIASAAPLIATAIGRDHDGLSLSGLGMPV